MITPELVKNIVEMSVIKVLKTKLNKFENSEMFIGIDSEYESIEIIQILSTIEEELEKKGFHDNDLLEIVANYETITLEELITEIVKSIALKFNNAN